RNRRALAATARDRAVPGAARYGAWQRVGGLPLGCGADVVVAACEAETPGSDRPSNRYSSGVLVPRLLAHLPHFLRLLTDLHQIITRLDVVLVWLGVAPCRVGRVLSDRPLVPLG